LAVGLVGGASGLVSRPAEAALLDGESGTAVQVVEMLVGKDDPVPAGFSGTK
jgi:hypothetical protein